MKLSKEDLDRIDKLKTELARYKSVGMLPVYNSETVNGLLSIIDKLQPRPKPERFTYEMRDCEECMGSGSLGTRKISEHITEGLSCKYCCGLGKTRTKVKRTAHSV